MKKYRTIFFFLFFSERALNLLKKFDTVPFIRFFFVLAKIYFEYTVFLDREVPLKIKSKSMKDNVAKHSILVSYHDIHPSVSLQETTLSEQNSDFLKNISNFWIFDLATLVMIGKNNLLILSIRHPIQYDTYRRKSLCHNQWNNRNDLGYSLYSS